MLIVYCAVCSPSQCFIQLPHYCYNICFELMLANFQCLKWCGRNTGTCLIYGHACSYGLGAMIMIGDQLKPLTIQEKNPNNTATLLSLGVATCVEVTILIQYVLYLKQPFSVSYTHASCSVSVSDVYRHIFPCVGDPNAVLLPQQPYFYGLVWAPRFID